jgi:hypothetical protein
VVEEEQVKALLSCTAGILEDREVVALRLPMRLQEYQDKAIQAE